MLTTHDSMRLPRLAERGFSIWRVVELTSHEPHFLLTVAFGCKQAELDLLFSLDQEVVAFLADHETALPVALHVLVRRDTAGSDGWQVVAVEHVGIVRPAQSTESLIVLRLVSGQTVRGRDMAPMAKPDADIITVAEFPRPRGI